MLLMKVAWRKKALTRSGSGMVVQSCKPSTRKSDISKTKPETSMQVNKCKSAGAGEVDWASKWCREHAG